MRRATRCATASQAARPCPYFDQTLESGFGGGNPIAIRGARIRIAGQEAIAVVADGDAYATFILRLEAGPTHLQTYFDVGEDDLGAYYVYVDRLDDVPTTMAQG